MSRTSGWLSITMSTEALMPGRSRAFTLFRVAYAGNCLSAFCCPRNASAAIGLIQSRRVEFLVRNSVHPHLERLAELDLATVHLVQFHLGAHRSEVGYLCHEGITVFVEDGDWYINIKNRCRHLSGKDYHCRIYEKRSPIYFYRLMKFKINYKELCSILTNIFMNVKEGNSTLYTQR
jgi:Fe-S-cluster containining protein